MNDFITVQLADGTYTHLALPQDPDSQTTLLSALQSHGIPVIAACQGGGICGSCEVERILAHGQQVVRSCQIQLTSFCHGDSVKIPGAQTPEDLSSLSYFANHHQSSLPLLPATQRYAVAIDLGTTTVAIALWDRFSGTCLAQAGQANAQRRYGDDVMSRIAYGIASPQHTRNLQQALIEQTLKPLLDQIRTASQILEENIYLATIVGNPVMLHSLCGASLVGFAHYPFHPHFLDQQLLNGADLDLPNIEKLQLLPSLSSFVGADVVAGAIANNLFHKELPALYIDFGTNGELLLVTHDTVFATATATGPAFEGGRLSCGHAAGPGVITAAWYHNQDWELNISAANRNAAPIIEGISGPAYIDILAAGTRAGFINPQGRLVKDHQAVTHDPDTNQLRIFLGPNCWVSEEDIAILIQAKAAIGAGIKALLEEAHCALGDIHRLVIAGGFGYHLNLENAQAVGLLPMLPLSNIEVVGNAALGGASQALFQPLDETTLQKNNCRIIELNLLDHFEDHYIDALTIAPLA